MSWKGEIKQDRCAKRTEINLDNRFQTNFVSNEIRYCFDFSFIPPFKYHWTCERVNMNFELGDGDHS